MKKLFSGIILALIALCLTADEGKNPNLLKNPGFEKTKPRKIKGGHKYMIEWLSGWGVADWGGKPKDGSKRGKVGLKTHADASEGKAAGYLYTTGEKRNNLAIYQAIKVVPGKKKNYILSFKFKKADDNDKDISVYASYRTFKGNAKTIAYKHSKSKMAMDEWQSIKFPFAVTADAESFRVILRANDSGIIFDDVKLKKQD